MKYVVLVRDVLIIAIVWCYKVSLVVVKRVNETLLRHCSYENVFLNIQNG